MKNYKDGFRYIALFGETVKNKAELDTFLKEKDYDFEEENDGLRLAVKEALGTTEELNKNFKVIMTRVPDDKKESIEKDIINESVSLVHKDFDENIIFANDIMTDISVELNLDKKEEKIEE